MQINVLSLVKAKLSKDISAREILTKGLVAGLENVSEKFSLGEFFLSYILQSRMLILELELKKDVIKCLQ